MKYCIIFSTIAITLSACGGQGDQDELQPIATDPAHQQSSAEAPAQQSTNDPAPAQQAKPAATTAESRSGDDHPPWQLPAAWQLADGERPMRHSTYLVPLAADTVEVAISHFPGDVGGLVANMNRWRGQLSLPPVDEAEAEALISRFANPGFSGYTVHLKGAEAHMLVGSIFQEAENRTWYVRATVTATQAEQLRDALFRFARSFGTSE